MQEAARAGDQTAAQTLLPSTSLFDYVVFFIPLLFASYPLNMNFDIDTRLSRLWRPFLSIGSNTTNLLFTIVRLAQSVSRKQLTCILLRRHAEVKIGSLGGGIDASVRQDLANGPLLDVLDDMVGLTGCDFFAERMKTMQCIL